MVAIQHCIDVIILLYYCITLLSLSVLRDCLSGSDGGGGSDGSVLSGVPILHRLCPAPPHTSHHYSSLVSVNTGLFKYFTPSSHQTPPVPSTYILGE